MDVPELAEGCIAHIITFTSPKDACVSALVSKMFQSAADSDDVWEKFLPLDYKDILSRSTVPINLADYPSKKQLYLRLCSISDPILLDGGTKSLCLEKTTGKKCIMVGARELGIAWGDTPQYWQWRSDYGSRFPEVARLIFVCWITINGKVDTQLLSRKTSYGAYLVIKHADEAYGFDDTPVDVSVTFAGGGTASGFRNVYLQRSPVDGARFPSERGDGWMEVEVGEFYSDLGEDGEVQVSVKEVTYLNGKGGLIVQGIEFRPKAFDR